jgi:hypothetical protein
LPTTRPMAQVVIMLPITTKKIAMRGIRLPR